jgi:hypothetical protein
MTAAAWFDLERAPSRIRVTEVTAAGPDHRAHTYQDVSMEEEARNV